MFNLSQTNQELEYIDIAPYDTEITADELNDFITELEESEKLEQKVALRIVKDHKIIGA